MIRFPDGVEVPRTHSWPLTLRAGSLLLRPLRWRDQAGWNDVRIRNQAWLAQWDATSPQGHSKKITFKAMVSAQRAAGRSGVALPFGLFWVGGGRPRLIGQVSVGDIIFGAARMAPIGYWIDQEFAGRGLMPTAVALVSDYCFAVLDLHRIEINIRPENKASLKVVQKLGFREEGLRPRFLHINGDWRDHRSFALTREEVGDGLLSRYLSSRPLA